MCHLTSRLVDLSTSMASSANMSSLTRLCILSTPILPCQQPSSGSTLAIPSRKELLVHYEQSETPSSYGFGGMYSILPDHPTLLFYWGVANNTRQRMIILSCQRFLRLRVWELVWLAILALQVQYLHATFLHFPSASFSRIVSTSNLNTLFQIVSRGHRAAHPGCSIY